MKAIINNRELVAKIRFEGEFGIPSIMFFDVGNNYIKSLFLNNMQEHEEFYSATVKSHPANLAIIESLNDVGIVVNFKSINNSNSYDLILDLSNLDEY